MSAAKKKLGAFYTPPELAAAMVQWAIRNGDEYVLEPSFGGCCFLDSTWQRLKDVGVTKPLSRLFGADIDSSAFNHLHNRFGIRDYSRRFVMADFLKLTVNDFRRKDFNVVIGNPPFIAHSALTSSQKQDYKQSTLQQGFKIKGKPSLWAFFVLSSLKFLKNEGRIAWVLPWSLLKSSYGLQLQEQISCHFKAINIFAIEEELFLSEGTKERTVVFLADTYSKIKHEAADINIQHCSTLNDFKRIIINTTTLGQAKNIKNTEKKVCERDFLAKKINSSVISSKLTRLGDIMNISIGIVTGDTKTFMMTREMTKILGLEKNMYRRCLVRGKYTKGLAFTRNDLDELENTDKPSYLLVIPPNSHLPEQLRSYLSKLWTKEEIANNKTFQKRSLWYSITPGQTPDAFFRFFTQYGPQFIINSSRACATNSLYVAHIKPTMLVSDRELILACVSLSTLSCLGQAHAELYSTRFGSGALKMSVAAVREIPVFITSEKHKYITMDYLLRVDQAVRNGKSSDAYQLASEWLTKTSGHSNLVKQIYSGFSKVREVRLGPVDSYSGKG